MEDRQAVAEADEWSASNQPIELESVLADLGLATTPLPRAVFESLQNTTY
jgi:hypothetical protein